MPANVTHMLIAHKALQTLKTKGIDEFTEFATMLDDTARSKNYKAYVNLGSMGPDLYYYAKLSSSVKDMLKEGFVQAKGVTPWSYHLHSHRPNEFPLKLVEIIFSDVIREDDKVKLLEDDIKKLAYIAGHLTHIAADQIIHPLVNSVAGPYYRRARTAKNTASAGSFRTTFCMRQSIVWRKRAGRNTTSSSRIFAGGPTVYAE